MRLLAPLCYHLGGLGRARPDAAALAARRAPAPSAGTAPTRSPRVCAPNGGARGRSLLLGRRLLWPWEFPSKLSSCATSILVNNSRSYFRLHCVATRLRCGCDLHVSIQYALRHQHRVQTILLKVVQPKRADTLWVILFWGFLGSLFGLFFLLWCLSSCFVLVSLLPSRFLSSLGASSGRF